MTELHVSTKGNDQHVSIKGKGQSARGSKAKPFKSISYAIRHIRTTNITDATKIIVSPGIYHDTIIIQEGKNANLYPSMTKMKPTLTLLLK
ncbi:hypothetical protein MNBD_GAMMA12-2602 [hydrothermal vent metagenome]|uniref:Uncharacterized protein n=1 Tax=hydrothermal vent metagenome TaxID=652676 RepID=A0A3B0Y7W0_9ZZZZ